MHPSPRLQRVFRSPCSPREMALLRGSRRPEPKGTMGVWRPGRDVPGKILARPWEAGTVGGWEGPPKVYERSSRG